MDRAFEERGWLEAIVRAGVKDAINAHGPITLNLIGSAAKRIAGEIRAGVMKELPNADGHAACRLRVAELEDRLAALQQHYDQQLA